MLSTTKKQVKMTFMISIAIVLFSVNASAQTTPKPNFTGSWVINLAKCDLGDFPIADTTKQLDIQQTTNGTGDIIIVGYLLGENLYREKDSLILNGQARKKTDEWSVMTDKEIRGKTVTTSTSKWDGDGLSVRQNVVRESKPAVFEDRTEVTRIYRLSQDGKNLTIETMIPKNDFIKQTKAKTVYEKK